MNILDQLAAHAMKRTAEAKKIIPAEEMRARAFALPNGDFSFERALRTPDLAFICECKKASPSKGSFWMDFITEDHRCDIFQLLK